MTAADIVWLRRDLRVHDHPALHAAAARGRAVVPVFFLDDRLLRGRHASATRTQFLLESLADLGSSLRELGSPLIVRHGRPERLLPALVRETGARHVHVTRDLTPFARSRGRGVAQALAGTGAELVAHPGLTVVEDVTALHTKAGAPYSQFTPFYRTWAQASRRKPLAAPSLHAPSKPLESDDVPELEALGLRPEVDQPLSGGETAGTERLDWFLDGPVDDYARTHDSIDVDGTSKLGAYLHLGCLSPRAVEAALSGSGEGPEAFRRQLCWRDFYHHVHYYRPQNAWQEHQERYRGTLPWTDDEEVFDAWASGRTGFPLVDAAMRQLLREGWMHNRARMLVGCFLTKHLGVDWRRGESHFMRLLLDGDQANNNGNWQWIASVGVDTAPVFRRLYSPTLHQKRYDPEGRYVRAYVPELADVPDRYLAEPWLMPHDVQEAAHCVIGQDYPEPIVDLRAAREQALARYREASSNT